MRGRDRTADGQKPGSTSEELGRETTLNMSGGEVQPDTSDGLKVRDALS
jgi:hypothetical protein